MGYRSRAVLKTTLGNQRKTGGARALWDFQTAGEKTGSTYRKDNCLSATLNNNEISATDFSSNGQPGMKQNKQCPEGAPPSESETEWQSGSALSEIFAD
ncbi:MAG: hypothetical protein FWC35_09330 [Proteobacteria bacterium]|nr:hypothetical protein [Pseudomonadota bacterium]